MRFLLNHARRSVASKPTVNTNKRTSKSVMESSTTTPVSSYQEVITLTNTNTSYAQNKNGNTNNNNLTKSWGQQCSPTCGCVIRIETTVDHKQRIVDCSYVAKSVVTTIDKKNGGRLTPVYTTRTNRPMFQECKCQSVHTLAKRVTTYLPNKRMSHIQEMNGFAFTIRSSLAFRHAVLAEHDLPRTDTHCFDVVEEAFSGMVNGNVPSKRRTNAPFQKILTAECLQRPLVVHYCRTKNNYVKEEQHHQKPQQYRHQRREESSGDDSGTHGRMGVDRNRISMSTSKTMSALEMFDTNAENWLDDDVEHDRGRETAMKSNSNRFDWVSYVDELHHIDDSA